MRRISTIMALVCMGSAASAALPQAQREWVTRELLHAGDLVPGDWDLNWWGAAAAQVDVGQDGLGDFSLAFNQVDSTGWGTAQRFVLYPGLRAEWQSGWQPIDFRFFPYSGAFHELALASGHAPRLVVLGWNNTPTHSFPSVWDIRTRGWIGDVHLGPNPPQPQLNSFGHIMRGGDVDQDGTDDFFFVTAPPNSGATASFGLVDGASRTIVWEYRASQNFFTDYTFWTRLGPTPDLNGDGASDFVFTEILQPIGGLYDSRQTAISGRDGALIWSRSAPQLGANWEKSAAILRDIDGDGVADVFAFGSDEFTMLSGATGAVIWNGTSLILGGSLPPGMTDYGFDSCAFSTDVQGNPGGWEIVLPTKLRGSGRAQMWALTHLDPWTGQLVELAVLPDTLAPWTSDPIHYRGYQSNLSLGDIDGDGHEEYCLPVPSPTTDNPANGIGNDWHMAIFGQKTLYMPATARIGAPLALDISIPAGANKPFRILVSESFDRKGGLRIDGWRTHLVPTPLFHRSAGMAALRGTLDARGEATLALTLPNRPALVGWTLYSKAIVENPAAPGKLLTMSSLGVTVVVP